MQANYDSFECISWYTEYKLSSYLLNFFDKRENHVPTENEVICKAILNYFLFGAQQYEVIFLTKKKNVSWPKKKQCGVIVSHEFDFYSNKI